MSVKQRLVVAAGLLAVLAMLIYPPFYVNYRGASYNLGRAFVFSPPKAWQVNFGLLIAQALGVLALTAGAYWACGHFKLKLTSLSPAFSWLMGKPPHPWRRYFARTLDIVISAKIMTFVVGLVLISLVPEKHDDFVAFLDDRSLFFLVWLAAWTFMEPFFLAFFGTTPAKLLFGIWVVNANGELLSLLAAFKRSLLVWYKGFVFGFPLFTVIAEILCYAHLKRLGTTPWDEATRSTVIHSRWGVGRALTCVMVLLCLIGLSWLNAYDKAQKNRSSIFDEMLGTNFARAPSESENPFAKFAKQRNSQSNVQPPPSGFKIAQPQQSRQRDIFDDIFDVQNPER